MAEATDGSRLWVLIAVAEWDDDGLAINQSQQLASLLQDVRRFPTVGPRLIALTDLKENAQNQASAENLRQSIRRISLHARPEDALLAVIVGSVAREEDDLRLLTRGARPDRPMATTMLIGELAELLNGIRCQQSLLMLELTEGTNGWPSTPAQADLRGFDWARVLGSKHRVAVGVAAAGKSALCSILFDGLNGAADRAGGEADGWIDAQEIFAYVANRYPSIVTEGPVARIDLGIHAEAKQRTLEYRQQLLRRQEAGDIDERTLETGLHLLHRMPPFEEDRTLRKAYMDFLANKIDASALEAQRRQVLTQRNVTPEEATNFADRVRDVHGLISKHHLQADQASPAISVGLAELAKTFDVADEPWVEETLRVVNRGGASLSMDALRRYREQLGKRKEITTPAEEICLQSAVDSLDPYSNYLPASAYREMLDHSRERLTGIGAVIRQSPIDHSLTILVAIPGGPAANAGLRAGDKIITIDQAPVDGDPSGQPADRLMGEVGSNVALVVRRGDEEPILTEVVRAEVKIDSVVGRSKTSDGAWNHWIDQPGGLAYVRITHFGAETAEALRQVIRQLETEAADGVILDLRFNPGGLLPSALAVADLFIHEGTLVRIQDGRNADQVLKARRFGTCRSLPVAVLINGESASGSEIVASALEDTGRGVIVGSRSFGKGSVQDVIPLERDQGAVKLTSARFARADGRNLDRYLGGQRSESDEWGVTPPAGHEVTLYPEESRRLQRKLLYQQYGVDRDASEDVPDAPLARAIELLQSAAKPPKPPARSN